MGDNVYDVIVIGGGLAGLAAAYQLQKHDQKALVLEALSKPGGRTLTQEVSGLQIPFGAEFFTPRYRHIMNLCEELGINLISESAEKYRININGNQSSFGYWQILKLIWQHLGQMGKVIGLAPGLFSVYQGATLDIAGQQRILPEDLQDIVTELNLSPQLVELFRGITQMTFHYEDGLTELNTGFIINWLKHVVAGKYLVPEGGIDQFACRLAARTQIAYNSKVTQLSRNQDIWQVTTNEKTFLTKSLILAIPAAASRRLLQTVTLPTSLTNLIEHTKYSSLTRMYFQTSSQLIPKGEVRIITEPDALTEFVSHINENLLVAKLKPQHKNASVAEVTKQLTELLDTPHLKFIHQDYVDPALPHFNSAHILRVKDYLENSKEVYQKTRLCLAGDYIYGPYTESAVYSGIQAANLVAPSY